MSSRRFNIFGDSFTSGYTTIGGFRPRTRAEQIHRGRSGIDRRHLNSLSLESAAGTYPERLNAMESKTVLGGSNQQRGATLATQTRTTSRNQLQSPREASGGGFRANTGSREVHFSGDQQNSRNRGIRIDFENENVDRGMSSRTFLDGTRRDTRPQRGSSYYNEVFSSTDAPFNAFGENTSRSRQQSTYQNDRQERDFADSGHQQTSVHSSQPNILREEVIWQPVKVIYVEKGTGDVNQGGMLQQQREYSSSSSYGNDSRQTAPQFQQSGYTEEWGGRQQNGGRVNRSHPPSYETIKNGSSTNGDRRHLQVEAQWNPADRSREGSYRRSTEVFQSRDDPTASNWNGDYQMVKTTPQRNDYIDGFSNSRSWSSDRGSQDREYGYPTRLEHTTYSTSISPRTAGLNPGSANHGEDSFTYRSQSRDTPRLLQNTGLNGSAFGARSQGRQVLIAGDDEYPRSSRVNFSSSSGLGLNGERSGGLGADFASHKGTTETEEKEFFGKLMKELENQRQNLKPEVDKLIRNSSVSLDDSGLMSGIDSITFEAGKNSYIDTSLPTPVFKAYVDIKEFSPKSVTVRYDQPSNKVVVEAGQVNAEGTAGNTFTQKIALPKYADDLRLIARMSSSGILRIEVPLLFYFPEEHEDARARSFLYEATKNSTDGSKALEIVVQPGTDYSLQDIQPEVINNTLVIWGGRGNQKKSIGKYMLPPTANVKNIKQRSGKDGSLTIVIPVT